MFPDSYVEPLGVREIMERPVCPRISPGNFIAAPKALRPPKANNFLSPPKLGPPTITVSKPSSTPPRTSTTLKCYLKSAKI